MNNKKTFYVTTPIYYPSGNLHIVTFTQLHLHEHLETIKQQWDMML